MLQFLKTYLVSVPVFLLIDIIWLSLIAKKFYHNQIGFLMSDQINWIAAIIFYLFYIVGIVFFAVLPALEKELPLRALLAGALLGAIAYATYDLSNLATLKGWPVKVVIVDILWGTVLTGSVSLITYYLTKLIK